MKIISLNTWAGEILDPMLTFFKHHDDVDVFCFQEVYRNAYGRTDIDPNRHEVLDLFERIKNALESTHVGYFRPCVGDLYGLAMFIKKDVPVISEGDTLIFEIAESKERGRHNMNLQYARFNIGNKPMTIMNVHGLWNGNGKTDTEDRLEQSRKICEFMSKEQGRKVLVGDFNLNPDTHSLAMIEEGMINLIKVNNITSTRTKFYTKEGKFADYAIVSPDVEVLDFKVLSDEVSDHAALYLECN